MEKSSKPFTLRARLKSTGIAMQGVTRVVRHEHNARIHMVTAGIASGLGLLLRISRVEWMLVLLCIGLVIGAEVMNTAMEKLVDLISPEKNEQAGMVKDISAAAVLIVAIVALLVGIIVFVPHLAALIKNLFSYQQQ